MLSIFVIFVICSFIYNHTQKQSDQLSLPIDATVHQLNADTVHFIESVEPYHDSIGQMISRRDERATASATESYVNYKQDLLGALAMNLRNKASDYKSQSTRCLFLMVRTSCNSR